jgi:hypothetical protein
VGFPVGAEKGYGGVVVSEEAGKGWGRSVFGVRGFWETSGRENRGNQGLRGMQG